MIASRQLPTVYRSFRFFLPLGLFFFLFTWSPLSGKKPLLPNNSVSDHYTAFLPPMEESPPPLSHPPSLPTTPSSSLRLSQGSIQSQHTTQRNSFAPTATSPPPLNSTPDDFINFIQQPTTRVYSSTSSTSLPLQGNEREKSLSDETGEKGVRLSSPPLQTSANIRSSKNEEFPFWGNGKRRECVNFFGLSWGMKGNWSCMGDLN